MPSCAAWSRSAGRSAGSPRGTTRCRASATRRARAEQGQAVEFVREEDRPEVAAVERLYDVYEDLAKTTGIFWLPTRARVAGQGGLRPSEQDALRLCDLRPDDLEVVVDGAFTWPRGGDGPVRKDPKNGKRRRVLLPASVRSLGHATDGTAADAMQRL